MLTIEIDSSLEANLDQIVQQEHKSPADIIIMLIMQYLNNEAANDLLVNVAQHLPPFACSAD
ncbi:MAG: hypothetical protein ACYC0M_03210 [Burkholderiales bacterium]